MTDHPVSCCKCGKVEHVKLQRAIDIIYLMDVMKELGWEQDRWGRWFCNTCSYKGGGDD